MKVTARLRSIEFHASISSSVFIRGIVSGDTKKRFGDGSYIKTTPVKKLTVKDGRVLATTVNSVYDLGDVATVKLAVGKAKKYFLEMLHIYHDFRCKATRKIHKYTAHQRALKRLYNTANRERDYDSVSALSRLRKVNVRDIKDAVRSRQSNAIILTSYHSAVNNPVLKALDSF